MSRYSIVRRANDLVIIGASGLGAQPMTVARLVPEVPIDRPQAYVDFISHLESLLAQTTPRAQFEVTQRLMTEEEFRQVQKLRERRELIQREMQYVALERTLEVRVAGFPRPHLTEPATRGVLSKLMDDLAHNGNAIRKLGVEPFAIDKTVAEAVEAALAVFLEPGAAE